jgi:divinyl protochlorophyllide a 8-vinyl-reductase
VPPPASIDRHAKPSDDTQPLIRPNAILQLIPVLEAAGGPPLVRTLMAAAGLTRLPDGQSMIPEVQAARLHQAMRARLPRREATAIAEEAGARTADYILAHRIPKAAQTILRLLPARIAAPILARAITRHAWTFAGSGAFRAVTPWRFEIADNPVVRGETADHTLCAWHAAVFQRLYRVLVAPDVTCAELTCCAVKGQGVCVFTLGRGAGGGATATVPPAATAA